MSRLLDASSAVDDGYVTERVLAVTCAAVLRGSELPTITADLRRFLERHGQPPHVLCRDYLVVTVNALAARYGQGEDLAVLSATALPPYPADWPGSHGLPDWYNLVREHPPFGPEAGSGGQTSGPDEEEVRRRQRVSGGYVTITSSLGEMGDFYRYEMHGNNPESFPFARQRLDEPHNGQPLEAFDLAVLSGWVFDRVLRLGWSPERFGAVDFDIEQERTNRDSHKRERFGKKYQWLAWYEALARLSGTQRFLDRDDSGAEQAYESAWQLDFLRDIDPTHLLDRAARDEALHWRALWMTAPLTLDFTVAPAAGQDGPADLPATDEASRIGNWWFPMQPPSPPAQSVGQDPVRTLAAWATDSADLPDLRNYLVVRADLEQWVRNGKNGQPAAGSRRYRLLHLNESLLDHPDRSEYPRADILANIDSVLMRREDLAVLEQWPGATPIDGMALDRSATDAIFLGEWPYAAAYRAMCDPAFRPITWQDAQGTDVLGMGLPAIVMTEDYVWEGSLLDCSISATLVVHVLTPGAAALFPGIRQRDGVARTANGDLLHMDAVPAPGGNSALLIDEALLAEALVRENLVLVQIIRQSKRVLTGQSDRRFAGDVTTARFVATVGQEELCDISWQWVRQPRLDE